MADVAQLNLSEPEQINWDAYDTGGSKYVAPPPALDVNGKAITYYGVVDKAEEETAYPDTNLAGDPVLTYKLDVRIVGSSTGDSENGKVLRFNRISTRPFYKNQPDGSKKALNANTAGNFLRATGLTAKPNTNDQYRAAIKLASQGKKFGFTIDWRAKDKQTGEEIRGYENFPLDPQRPGYRSSVVKAGQVYTDRDGQVRVATAEVLFANAQIRYFQDPSRANGNGAAR